MFVYDSVVRKIQRIFRVGIGKLLIYKVSLKRLKTQWIIHAVGWSLLISTSTFMMLIEIFNCFQG